jgi:GntR family transcriptional regulator
MLPSRSVAIRQRLVLQIERGELREGDRLPSEPRLAENFGVSRATVREALRSLVDDGLLRRRQGSGTYVSNQQRVSNCLNSNFPPTEAINGAGMTADTVGGRSFVQPASLDTAARLQVAPGSDIAVLERTRTANGDPAVWCHDMLPGWTVTERPDVLELMLTNSIYEMFERHLGIIVHHGVANIRAITADRALGQRLNVSVGEPLLYLLQTDFTEDDVPVLSSDEYYLPSFDFTVVRRGPGLRFA